MYKKALVPLDGSDLAARALPQVGSLVEEGLVEEVTLLNVVNVGLPVISQGMLSIPSVPAV